MTPTGARLNAARAARPMWMGIAAALMIVGAGGVAFWLRAPSYTLLQAGQTTPIAVSPELEGEPAISPNGKLVAYVSAGPAGRRIFVRQIDGGRANLLTDDVTGNYAWPRWSPDGSRISFMAQGGVYIVAAFGGTSKRAIADGATHAWSPDGKHIAFERDDGLWVKTLDGDAERKVLSGAFVHSPVWSPDGRFLAYAEGRRPTMSNVSTNVVWVVPQAGGAPVRISDSTRTNVSPVWTPDGRSVLFVSSAGGIRDVYQQPVRANGRPHGTRVRLTTGLSAFTISLSADGSRMAYDVVRNFANVWMAPIARATATGWAQATQVTRENQHVESMDVSHDGKWIVYDSDGGGGNFDIYKMRLDGGEPIQLTSNPSNEFHPVWSPDDKEIAFHSQRSGVRHIYAMTADGNAETQVTNGVTQDYCRAWSPDGQHIAFASVADGGDRSYRARLTTRQPNRGWSPPQPISPDSDRAGFGSSSWSPDGKAIAYTRDGDIVTIPAAGGPSTVLVTRRELGGPVAVVTWGDASTLYATVGTPMAGVPTSLSAPGMPLGGRIAKIMAIAFPGGAVRPAIEGDAMHHLGREEFATDGKRLFFTLAAWESDVGVMELTKRP